MEITLFKPRITRRTRRKPITPCSPCPRWLEISKLRIEPKLMGMNMNTKSGLNKKSGSSTDRRDFLKKASAGGLGMSFLGSTASAEIYSFAGSDQSKPAAKPKIRITDLRCAIIANSAVVRITTDQGISGYGQGETTKPYLKPNVLFYKDYLIGEDPTDVERIMMKIRRMGSFKPWGAAVSAIEIALWDLAGKAAGVPVYKLLGGKIRDHVRCYNGGVRVTQGR